MAIKRTILVAAAMAAAFGLISSVASQERHGYPNRPIRLVVPNPPGGTTDVLARVLAEELGPRLGQAVVVENRAGASGTIGSDAVAKAAPDGYMLVMGHAASHATSPSMYPNLPYHPIRDFAPVTLVANVTNALVVHPDVPAKSVKELIALAKSRPGKLVFGSGGTGAITHLAGEIFEQTANVDLLHVPYKGSSPAMADLLGGHISIMFENLPGAVAHIRSGKLRGLAVLSPTRSKAVPDLPTIAEAGLPGAEAVSWFGLFTTAGTPREVVEKLNQEIVAVIRKPEVQARMADVGAEPVGGTPEEFRRLVQSEIEKWAKVIEAANVKPGK